MTKLRIKPVNHGSTKRDRNRYCGPAVISSLTGYTTADAARCIRDISNRRSVTGTSTEEVLGVLRTYGINCVERKGSDWGVTFNRTNGATLAGWLKASVKDRNSERIWLVVAGWHWQLVQGRRYVCGLTKEIVSIRDKRVKRRARVAEVYELSSR